MNILFLAVPFISG